MSELVVLVPVLKRPHRVKPLLDAFEQTTKAAVHFIVDPDDTEEREAIRAAGGQHTIMAGNYAQKIAVGVRVTDEPLIFTAADDLKPHEGWFEAAKAYLRDGIEVVGVNDLIERKREHTTHFLMTRAYAEQPTIDGGGGPFHAGYDHSFTDDELIATAKHRGAYAYASDAIVEHLHFMSNKAPMDATYEKGLARFRLDGRLFRARSRLWT